MAKVSRAGMEAWYAVAARWVDAALHKGDSLFIPGRPVWTPENLDEVHRRYVVNFNEQKGLSFFEKLDEQLAGARAEVRQLTAELLYLYYLPMSGKVKPETKREAVGAILAGTVPPVALPADLAAALDLGVAHESQAYNHKRYYQLKLFVEVIQKWWQADAETRSGCLTDPWRFKDFASQVEPYYSQPAQQMLLHIVHPDTFEPVMSGTDKAAIAESLATPEERTIPDPDRRLLAIRERLTPERGPGFSFYHPELKALWQPADGGEEDDGEGAGDGGGPPRPTAAYLLAWNPIHWNWEALAAEAAAVREGRSRLPGDGGGRWSCKNSRARRGDRFFLTKLGRGEPKGIMASGFIASDPYPMDHWDPGKAADGQKVLSVDLAYDVLLDPAQQPLLDTRPFADGEGPLGEVEWTPMSSGIAIRPPEAVAALEAAWAEHLRANAIVPLATARREAASHVPQPAGVAGGAGGPPDQLRDDVAYWALSAGEDESEWKDFLSNRIAAIGWDLGDLSRLDKATILQKLTDERGEGGAAPTNDAKACYDFAHRIGVGDYVVAKVGGRKVLGLGIVRSAYRYDPTRSGYKNVRDVEWIAVKRFDLPEAAWVPYKTLTEVTGYDEFRRVIAREFGTAPVPPGARPGPTPPSVTTAEPPPPYSIEQAMDGLFMRREDFEQVLRTLRLKKNVILQGPPGVGKTFVAKRLAYALMGAKDPARVEMVQFHQSYAYEDFVQGWRPNEGGGFFRKDGIFHEFCAAAAADPANRYVFIIDEINRGNLSKIFGELLGLIEPERRGTEFQIPLTYSRNKAERFHVPANVHLLGMMNTADRSLAMVDYALRRRFAFFTLEPGLSTQGYRDHMAACGAPADVVQRIVDRIEAVNARIAEDRDLGPGFRIGHSYFTPTNGTPPDAAWYRAVVDTEIAPLLEEYWRDDQRKKAEEALAELRT